MEAKDILKEMVPMYGEHCLSRQAVHNWVQKFWEGRTSIEDKFYAAGFQGLVKRFDKCLNLYGDYVEKKNVDCMSLSPFYSFQSRFVTHLLNRPRRKQRHTDFLITLYNAV